MKSELRAGSVKNRASHACALPLRTGNATEKDDDEQNQDCSDADGNLRAAVGRALFSFEIVLNFVLFLHLLLDGTINLLELAFVQQTVCERARRTRPFSAGNANGR